MNKLALNGIEGLQIVNNENNKTALLATLNNEILNGYQPRDAHSRFLSRKVLSQVKSVDKKIKSGQYRLVRSKKDGRSAVSMSDFDLSMIAMADTSKFVSLENKIKKGKVLYKYLTRESQALIQSYGSKLNALANMSYIEMQNTVDRTDCGILQSDLYSHSLAVASYVIGNQNAYISVAAKIEKELKMRLCW